MTIYSIIGTTCTYKEWYVGGKHLYLLVVCKLNVLVKSMEIYSFLPNAPFMRRFTEKYKHNVIQQ